MAIDHGFFNESSFLKGIENIEAAVRSIVAAGPDAVQLTVGQADVLQRIRGRHKPSLVLRTDVANVYGKKLESPFSRMIADPVGQALRLDAACVVVNLFRIPGAPEVTEHCIENILAIKPECEAYGMPLMIEPLVFKANDAAGGYMVDGDLEKIAPLVRQATELGADVIKADPTDDPSVYGEVVRVARVPVLVRGGGKATDEEIFARTHALMRAGASGIVYGRNVVQHPNPSGMVRALMAIVHEDANPSDAAKLLTSS